MSTDCNDIDMVLVKNSILTPLTYICNFSLPAGIFPNRMKMTKVLSIHNFHHFSTLRGNIWIKKASFNLLLSFRYNNDHFYHYFPLASSCFWDHSLVLSVKYSGSLIVKELNRSSSSFLDSFKRFELDGCICFVLDVGMVNNAAAQLWFG